MSRTRRSRHNSCQTEELESLMAIFGPEMISYEHRFNNNSERHLNIFLKSDTFGDLDLNLRLPIEYPQNSPPIFEISAPHMGFEMKQTLSRRLQNIYGEKIGQPILYDWINAAQNFISEITISGVKEIFDEEEEEVLIQNCDDEGSQIDDKPCPWDEVWELPEIFSGDPLTDRRSTFQAHVASITCKEQVRQILAHLLANNKIARATHNIYAYRIITEGPKPILIQDCEDDGEIGAGSKLMHLLELLDSRNVLVSLYPVGTAEST